MSRPLPAISSFSRRAADFTRDMPFYEAQHILSVEPKAEKTKQLPCMGTFLSLLRNKTNKGEQSLQFEAPLSEQFLRTEEEIVPRVHDKDLHNAYPENMAMDSSEKWREINSEVIFDNGQYETFELHPIKILSNDDNTIPRNSNFPSLDSTQHAGDSISSPRQCFAPSNPSGQMMDVYQDTNLVYNGVEYNPLQHQDRMMINSYADLENSTDYCRDNVMVSFQPEGVETQAWLPSPDDRDKDNNFSLSTLSPLFKPTPKLGQEFSDTCNSAPLSYYKQVNEIATAEQENDNKAMNYMCNNYTDLASSGEDFLLFTQYQATEQTPPTLQHETTDQADFGDTVEPTSRNALFPLCQTEMCTDGSFDNEEGPPLASNGYQNALTSDPVHNKTTNLDDLGEQMSDQEANSLPALLTLIEKRSKEGDSDGVCDELTTALVRDLLNSKGKKKDSTYIALISRAIFSSPDKKMLLSDIYDYLSKIFKFDTLNSQAWRNSVRHNLSLNECFVKHKRFGRGRGHYWSIHPACVEDFAKGDFRRRQARRLAQRGSTSGKGAGRKRSAIGENCTNLQVNIPP